MNHAAEANHPVTSSIRRGMIAAGVLEIIVGLVAIAVAGLTTFLSVFLLGVFITVHGCIIGFHALRSFREGGAWYRLASGILSVVIGLFLMFRPMQIAGVLTIVLAAFFVSVGVFQIIAAPISQMRNWGWVFLSGIVALVLGFMILAQWPVSALWFIGIVIGSQILIEGISTLGVAAGMKTVEDKLGHPKSAVSH
jgi:uncharacterized membrane protein HdeD (DUF308 family)